MIFSRLTIASFFSNFRQIEKWEFWKKYKGFFLCFDHFLVCWNFTMTFLVAGRLRRIYENPLHFLDFRAGQSHFPKKKGGFSNFCGRWASQNLCKSLVFPVFPPRTIALSKKVGGVLDSKIHYLHTFPIRLIFRACNPHSSLSKTVN